MVTVAKINEIFASIQGEGPYIGYKQLFIRFCGCNLKCAYCDTNFTDGKFYTPHELNDYINENYDLSKIHSISLTGGEPLLSFEFLKEFLPLVYGKTKIYLETNATLNENFEEIKTYIDIVSADIKLMSTTGYDSFALHKIFLGNCTGIETFAKIVFDENISLPEIEFCTQMGKFYDIELILQPKTINDKIAINPDFYNKILDKFVEKYSKVRLIPQVQKFLNVR